MMKLETYSILATNIAFGSLRIFMVIEGIALSTKTKAQDYLPDSTTFKDRVIKKLLRTKLFDDVALANAYFDLYQELIKFDAGEITEIDFLTLIDERGL